MTGSRKESDMYSSGIIKGKSGFTLTELMVTALVVVIISAGVYSLYIRMHETQVGQEIKAEMNQTARNTLDTVSRELMMAGYHGEMISAGSTSVEFSYWKQNEVTRRVKFWLDGATFKRSERADDDAALYDTEILAENVQGVVFKYFKGPDAASETAVLDDIRRITVQLTIESKKADPSTGRKQTMVLN